MDKVITGNAVAFLERYTTSYAHRLLRTPLGGREGMMVKDLIGKSQEYAMTLGVQQQYHPEKIFSLRIANFIDQSAFLRLLFLGFKKIWKKPVLH